jgi:hypothetical protein
MKPITYHGGYKYQLKETYTIIIGIKPDAPIATDYINLDSGGNLAIMKGYAWDGSLVPAIDTPTFMRGSVVHDALYQLMREKHLDPKKHRKAADRILHKVCIEDGMSSFYAWFVYECARVFADPAADPADKRPAIRAPEFHTA